MAFLDKKEPLVCSQIQFSPHYLIDCINSNRMLKDNLTLQGQIIDQLKFHFRQKSDNDDRFY